MVSNTIITTTINPPSKALKLFAGKKDWDLIIVGDLITPHELFRNLEKKHRNVTYLSPEDQEKKYPELSKAIGWNCIQRRNIGYVEAYERGARIVATVDDDNIPLDGWGESLMLEKKIVVNYYETELTAFDPVGATNYPYLWHRGYPLQLISKRNYSKKNKKTITADIQADFWNGDPDIDAICRMEYAPECTFDDKYFPIASNRISPFNSQNTFLTRRVLKDYFLFPNIGRMDDIWASYHVQALGFKVIYGKASVYHERNTHYLTEDMKAEYLGYENNLNILESIRLNPENIMTFLPDKSKECLNTYLRYF